MSDRIPPTLALIFSAAVVFPGALGAQTSVARASENDEEPVQLKTFVIDVEKDVGYIAVDSLAGGRTNTPIKLTPAAMSSLTRAFLDDAAVDDIREALQWTLNVIPSDYAAGKTSSPFGDYDYNFRGTGQAFRVSAGPTRNYFTYYQTGDTYNVERVEFDRGPNSILFGVGTVGGVLSSYTKQATLEKDLGTAQFTTDSNGSVRYTLDVNRRLLKDKLAVRLNLLTERREGWQDNDWDKQRAADVALTWQISEKTTLRLDSEINYSERSFYRGTSPEGTSRYDGVSASNTWAAAPVTPAGAAAAANATARISTGTYWNVYIPAMASLGVQNWNVGYRSNGVFLPIAPQAGWYPSTMTNGTLTLDGSKMDVLPSREFTIGALDSISKPEYTTNTLWLTHRFSDSLELALSGYTYRDSRDSKNYEGVGYLAIDLNKQLPNGQNNPKYGKRFGDFMLSQQDQDRKVDEVRAQLTYKLKGQLFGRTYQQTISASAGYQTIDWHARQFNAQVLNAGITTASNRILRARIYEDDTHPNVGLSFGQSLVGSTQVAYASHDSNWFDFDEDYTLKNVAAFSHVRALDDRLSVLVGARRDDYEQFRLNAIVPTTTQSAATGTTYSAGAVYYFAGPLGAFVNYSENFEPAPAGSSPRLSGVPHTAATGEGVDAGFRLSSKDAKYYVTATYYDAKSRDRINYTNIGLSNIWNLYFDARGEARDAALGSLSFTDIQSLHISGYEFEVTANPTKSLRLQGSFSKPESEIVEALADQRAYYAANYAKWDAAANLGNTAATNLRTALVNGQTTLDNNVAGKTVTGLADYTANLFANYSFLAGPLEGFSIGGGFSRTGRQYSTIIRNETYYRDARDSTNLVLAYKTKFGRVAARFSLNVTNLLDETDPVISSYDGSWRDSSGKAIANGYFLPTPRTFRFSASFSI